MPAPSVDGTATAAPPEDSAAAFHASLAAIRRRRSLRVVVLGVALFAIVGGTTMYRRMTQRREGMRATAVAWTALERCLVGPPLAPGETAKARMLRMELSLPQAAGATEPADAEVAKRAWPARCAGAAADLHRTIMDAHLDALHAYRRLSAAAARASVPDPGTWSSNADLPDELWTAAKNAGVLAQARMPTPAPAPLPFPDPPAAPRLLTAASLQPLPIPSGSTAEERAVHDADKVVVAFTHERAPGETWCAFGPGADGRPLAAVHCEDGSGVLLEREPAPTAFVRNAAGRFDRFELVRPRLDKEPWVDALSPDTRAAALYGEELVYVRPGPDHPDLLFARSAKLTDAGQEPLGDPVPLGAIDGRAHEFATCAWNDGLVVRVRSYDAHLTEQDPGESWATFAFFANGAWSHAPQPMVAGNAAALTCRPGEGALTWVQGDAVAQVRCDAERCSKLASGPLLRAWTHMQRVAVSDLDGRALVVGIADGSGPLSPALVHSVRMRLGPVQSLADAPDVVLWGDAQHEGADPTSVNVFSRQAAAIVLLTTSDGAVRALRVDPKGTFAPAEIVK